MKTWVAGAKPNGDSSSLAQQMAAVWCSCPAAKGLRLVLHPGNTVSTYIVCFPRLPGPVLHLQTRRLQSWPGIVQIGSASVSV